MSVFKLDMGALRLLAAGLMQLCAEREEEGWWLGYRF
jgi:hypothetical protein